MRQCFILIYCVPRRRNTNFPTWCCGMRTSPFPAHRASAPSTCSTSRPCSARKSKRKGLPIFTKRLICRSLQCSLPWSGTACASIATPWRRCPRPWNAKCARSKKTIWDLSGSEFNINSPLQLAAILFDKLNLGAAGKRRSKPRSTAAEVLEELALTHELPRKVLEYREISKLKSTYVDALPRLIHADTG